MTTNLRRAFDAAVQAAQKRSDVLGRLGKVERDGSITLQAERPGYVHVRLGPEGTLGASIAHNAAGVPLRAHLPVRMRREQGVLVIHGLDYEGGRLEAALAHDAPTVYGVPKHHHRIGSGMAYEVEALLLEPGRVRPHSGLNVWINPFFYSTAAGRAFWPGGALDLTPYKPGAGQWAWALVGIDPATNGPVAAAGTEVGSSDLLTTMMLAGIDFGSALPCAGIKLSGDDTALTDITRFTDAREWLNRGGGASRLRDLADVSFLGDPSEGQILLYAGGAWTNDVLLLSHSELQNLSADDHAQYVHRFGRAGGQTVAGGAGPGEGLTLESTSDATKGAVLLNPNGGNVGIGNTTPNVLLSVGDDLGAFPGSKRISVGNASGPSAINLGTDSQNRVFLFWNPTSKLFAFGTRVDGTNYNSFAIDKEKVLINAPANATPEATLDVRGSLRALDALGGVLFVTRSGITATPQTLIPGTQDKFNKGCTILYHISVGAGSVGQGGLVWLTRPALGEGQADTPAFSGNQYRFTLSADIEGLRIRRIAGTASGYLTAWIVFH